MEKRNEKKAEPLYTREQLLRSARYAARRDMVRALFKNGKSYTALEADTIINKYLKKKVL